MSMFRMVMDMEHDRLRTMALNAARKHLPETVHNEAGEQENFRMSGWLLHEAVSRLAISGNNSVDTSIYTQCLISVITGRLRQESGTNLKPNYAESIMLYLRPIDVFRAVVLALPFPPPNHVAVK